MEENTRIIAIALSVLGVVALFFSTNDQIKWLTAPGLLLLAAGIALFGVRDISNLRAYEYDEHSRRTHTYTGVTAILGGVFLLMIAAGLAAAGLAAAAGTGDALWDYLRRRPGVGLLLLGVSFLAGGTKYLIGPKEDQGTQWDVILRSLPRRVFGAFLALLGLAGALEALAPAGFDRLIARLF